MRNLMLFLHLAGAIFWMGGMAFMVMALFATMRPVVKGETVPDARVYFVPEKQPVTVAPRRANSSTSALIPAPAMPTKWTGRGSAERSGGMVAGGIWVGLAGRSR